MFPRIRAWAAVTKSDATVLPPGVGLFVTTGGAVCFETDSGGAVTVTVPSNFYLWGDVRKVLSTGTDADGIFHLRG